MVSRCLHNSIGIIIMDRESAKAKGVNEAAPGAWPFVRARRPARSSRTSSCRSLDTGHRTVRTARITGCAAAAPPPRPRRARARVRGPWRAPRWRPRRRPATARARRDPRSSASRRGVLRPSPRPSPTRYGVAVGPDTSPVTFPTRTSLAAARYRAFRACTGERRIPDQPRRP